MEISRICRCVVDSPRGPGCPTSRARRVGACCIARCAAPRSVGAACRSCALAAGGQTLRDGDSQPPSARRKRPPGCVDSLRCFPVGMTHARLFRRAPRLQSVGCISSSQANTHTRAHTKTQAHWRGQRTWPPHLTPRTAPPCSEVRAKGVAKVPPSPALDTRCSLAPPTPSHTTDKPRQGIARAPRWVRVRHMSDPSPASPDPWPAP